MARVLKSFGVAVLLLAVAMPAIAFATPSPPPSASTPPAAPSAAIDRADQVRGMSCLTGALAGAGGTWAFAELAATAGSGALALPVLVPLIAAGFVTGCEVGSTMLPALYAVLGGE